MLAAGSVQDPVVLLLGDKSIVCKWLVWVIKKGAIIGAPSWLSCFVVARMWFAVERMSTSIPRIHFFHFLVSAEALQGGSKIVARFSWMQKKNCFSYLLALVSPWQVERIVWNWEFDL